MSNYKSTVPFTDSHIYEYSDMTFSNYLKNSSQSLTTIKKNNQITSSLSYLVDKSQGHYIIFKFIPNYNTDYIIAKACTKYNKYEFYKEKKKSLII